MGISSARKFQPAARPTFDKFSPFVLADRMAFVLLCVYFVFWPVWYVSEAKNIARLGDFRIEHLAVILIVTFSLGSFVVRKTPLPGFWPLSLLVVYGGLSLVWSVDAKAGALVLLNLASVFFFVKILAAKPSRQRSALWSFVLGSILMLLIAVVRSDAEPGDYRLLLPPGIDANQLAVIGAIAVVILTSAVIAGFEVNRAFSLRSWCGVAVALSLAFVIFLLGSRTGSLATIVGASLVLFVRKQASGKLGISRQALMIIPTLALIGVVLVEPLMASRHGPLLQRYREGFFKGDLSGRLMVWRAGVAYYSSSARIMVVGGGLGGFGGSVVGYLDKDLFKVAVRMALVNPSRIYPYFAAHNDFLSLACDLGVVGLGLILAFYVQVSRACWRAPTLLHGSILPFALLATLVLSASGIDLVNFPLYPMVLALLISPCVRSSAGQLISLPRA